MESDILVFCSTPEASVIKDVREINPDILRINIFSNGISGAEVSIEPNNFASGALAASHLCRNGHRDLLCIYRSNHLPQLNRAKSFSSEIQFMYPECRVSLLPFTEWSLMDQEFTRYFQMPGHLPSAVFCTSGKIGYALLSVLRELKLRVPEDISVVSHDLPEDLNLTPSCHLDAVIFRPQHLVQLAEYFIVNRLLSPDELKITLSPNIELDIHGSVKCKENRECGV